MSFAHLRPLTAGEILDRAFVLYRRHFATVVTTSLVPLLPPIAFWSVVAASPQFALPEALVAALDAGAYAVQFYEFLVLTFVLAALVRLAAVAIQGGDPTPADAFRFALRRFPTLFVTSLATGLAVLAALVALVLPGIAVFVLLTLSSQVVVIEGAGTRDAISRSWALSRPEWRRVAGVLAVAMLTFIVPGLLVQEAAGLAGEDDFRITAAATALDSLVFALTYPVFALGTTLLYYDCRVRSEGLDVEAAADRLPVPA